MPATRYSRFERRSLPELPLPLPFGTFIPQALQPLRAAFALNGSTCKEAYRCRTPDLSSLPAS